MNTMQGCSFFAVVNIAFVRRGVSPIHFLSSREGTMRIMGRFDFLDRASTRAVLPHPGDTAVKGVIRVRKQY
jgi:hypothetical protein